MSKVETDMSNTPAQLVIDAQSKSSNADYRQFMMRELAIWLVGVPVPIAAVIGFFIL